MGGGDLNVKKSWHVSNFNNVERVYLAEQKDIAEKRKIAELMKERAEQSRIEDLQAHAVSTGAVKKKQERVEFLYQGSAPSVDREAYILGKKIDKAVEIESKDDLDIGNAPGAAFTQGPALSALDLSKKVRDDPLFAIKRKEQEGVRNVLNNPVRMKQLMDLRLATKSKSKKSKKEKKEKKEKKGKKEKKSRRERTEEWATKAERSSSPESDAPEPRERADQRQSPARRRADDLPTHRRSRDRDIDGDRPRESRGRDERDARSDRDLEEDRARGGYRRADSGPRSSDRRSDDRASSRRRSRSRSRSPGHRRSRPRASRSPVAAEPSKRGRSRSPPPRGRNRSRSPPSRAPTHHHRTARRDDRTSRRAAPRVDDSERLRKLEEMKANASWHDGERTERAKEHAVREAEQEVRDAERTTDGFGQAAFMDDFNRESFNSAAAGSVADQLNRNRHFIQRTSAALDSQSFKR